MNDGGCGQTGSAFVGAMIMMMCVLSPLMTAVRCLLFWSGVLKRDVMVQFIWDYVSTGARASSGRLKRQTLMDVYSGTG